MTEYNIYCDETCHLENDDKPMVIGAIWCKKNIRYKIFEQIKELKARYKISKNVEIKWNKVSPSKSDFYFELVSYFFKNPHLHFRAIVIPDKAVLEHQSYKQSHDDFYYKMYFDMLKLIITPENSYNIFLDIKDTKGFEKIQKLKDVIHHEKYDFSNSTIAKIQEVRSEEVNILQLTDLLIGALSYSFRDRTESKTKQDLVKLIRDRSGYSLNKSTLPTESKFNFFIWKTGYNRKRE